MFFDVLDTRKEDRFLQVSCSAESEIRFKLALASIGQMTLDKALCLETSVKWNGSETHLVGATVKIQWDDRSFLLGLHSNNSRCGLSVSEG